MLHILGFSFYIRSILEVSQFILVSSYIELLFLKTDEFNRIFSLSFAILMIFLYILLIGFVFYLSFYPYKHDISRRNILGEFFIGIKDEIKSRIYIVLLLLRRLMFVLFFVVLSSISSNLVIIALLIIQAAYLGYLIISRPYENANENVIEIVNDSCIISFLVALISFGAENEWGSFKNFAFLFILVSNFAFTFLIVFIPIIIKFKIYVQNKCKNGQILVSNNELELKI